MNVITNDNKFSNLIDYILKLKTVKRTGWISKAKILKAESVADHQLFINCFVNGFF